MARPKEDFKLAEKCIKNCRLYCEGLCLGFMLRDGDKLISCPKYKTKKRNKKGKK